MAYLTVHKGQNGPTMGLCGGHKRGQGSKANIGPSRWTEGQSNEPLSRPISQEISSE